MIIIGGIGFYLNSIINVIVATNLNPSALCMLSIFNAYTIKYIGYLCLIFRSKRIFKIIELEKEYIDKIYSLCPK